MRVNYASNLGLKTTVSYFAISNLFKSFHKLEVFQPKFDNRYADKEIVTHDNNKGHAERNHAKWHILPDQCQQVCRTVEAGLNNAGIYG